MADIKYLITVDAQGAIKSIKDFEGAIDGAGSASAKAEPKHQSLWKQVALGAAAYDVVKKAAGFFWNQLKDCTKGAIDEEQAERDLTSALELSGRSLEGNLKHYLDFANSKSLITRYTHEEIQGAQALLLQYLDLDQRGIDQATKGTMGFASVMKMDLQSAATMITRSINNGSDSIGKMKIKVDESLPPQLRQAAILDQLAKLYGRSTSEVDTFGGRMGQLKKAADEVKESFGGAVTKNQAFNKFLGELTDKINGLAADGTIEKWAKGLGTAFIDVAKIAVMSVKGIVLTWDAGRAAIFEGASQLIIMMMKPMSSLFLMVDTASKVVPGLKGIAKDLAVAIKDMSVVGMGFDETSGQMTGKTLDAMTAFEGLEKTLNDAKTALNSTGGAAVGAGAGINQAGNNAGAFTGKLKTLDKTLDDVFKATGKMAGKVVESNGEWGMGGPVLTAYGNILSAVSGDAEGVNAALTKIAASAAAARAAVMKKPEAKSWQDWGQDVQGIIQNVFGGINTLLSGMNSVNQQTLSNTLANIDAEYQARKKAIEKSLFDEETKNGLMAALDEEFEGKKLKAKREAAMKQKQLDIAQAYSAMAQAILAALQVEPFFPLGLAMAAIAGGMALKQVEAIKAQPIPLARGMVFNRTTEFMTQGGGHYVGGEDGVEVFASEKVIRRVVREEMSGRGGSGGGRPISVTMPIYIGGRKVDEVSWAITQSGIDQEKIILRGRHVKVN